VTVTELKRGGCPGRRKGDGREARTPVTGKLTCHFQPDRRFPSSGTSSGEHRGNALVCVMGLSSEKSESNPNRPVLREMYSYLLATSPSGRARPLGEVVRRYISLLNYSHWHNWPSPRHGLTGCLDSGVTVPHQDMNEAPLFSGWHAPSHYNSKSDSQADSATVTLPLALAAQ
jgi:hypothetical protein